MCTVEKMLIKGIRSFSPDNTDAIEFYKPLTLIVGENGSGKTTIIECLKMACTGDLPPNSRSGQTFVHDPKIAGETEVKAQIKLRFLTPNTRKPVVCVRNLKLVQKKSKLEYKALEGLIQAWNESTGQAEALSHRCADMDRAVPALMGVSKAVLDSVIFVHQDDANWPLSDPATLKKKFDDIFSATKYTKALEAIRKLKLEQNQKVKEMSLKLQTLESHKVHAERLKSSVDEDRMKSKSIEREIGELQVQSETISERLLQMQEKMSKIDSYTSGIQNLAAKLDAMSTQHSSLKKKLGEQILHQDTSELKKKRACHSTKMLELEQSKMRVQEQIRTLALDEEALRDQLNREMKLQGKLQAEADAHRRNVSKMVSAMHSLSKMYPEHFQGADHCENSAGEFISSATALLDQFTMQLNTMKQKHQLEEEKFHEESGAVVTLIASTEEVVRARTNSLAESSARCVEIDKELDQMADYQADVKTLEAKKNDVYAELQKKKSNLQQDSTKAQLQTLSETIKDVRAQLSDLRREREKVAKSSDSLSRLQFKKEERQAKLLDLEALVAKNKGEVCEILQIPHFSAVPSLAIHAEAVLVEYDQTMQTKADRLQKLVQSRGILQGRLDEASSEHSGLLKEAKLCQAKLRDALGLGCTIDPTTLDDRLAQAEESASAPQQNVSRLQAMVAVYQSYSLEATEHHHCPVCMRGFSGKEEEEFCGRVQELSNNLPELIEHQKEKYTASQGSLITLQKLQPVWRQLELLEHHRIPEKSALLDTLQSELQQLQSNLAIASTEHKKCEEEKQKLESVTKHVLLPLDKLERDISKLDAEILQMRNASEDTDGGRTITEIDKEIERVESIQLDLEMERDTAANSHSMAQQEISSMEHEWRMIQDEIFEGRKLVEKHAALVKEKAEHETAMNEMEEQLYHANSRLESLLAKKQDLLDEHRRLKALNEKECSMLQQRIQVLQSEMGCLKDLHDLVLDYDLQGRSGKLFKVIEALQATKRAQTEHGQSIDCARRNIEGLEVEMRREQAMDHVIEDNLQLRSIEDSIVAIKKEKEELFRLRDAIADLSSLEGDIKVENAKLSELKDAQMMMKGSLNTYAQQIKSKERELNSQEYRDICTRHRIATAGVQATKMAVQDLEKYYTALDRALLAFHRQRMEEVNKIIKELWQKTYRNQDIDYVQVKADTESARAGAARSYNYRVVMRSGDAELDMRGRCSAGQKVLACLVIRLALAEVFCLNCGILALDEPTTNLDSANSQSLAQSLLQLMEQRRDQEGFQLIVITHDEQFAHLIRKGDHAETYYRISKDEFQHSTIREQLVNGT